MCIANLFRVNASRILLITIVFAGLIAVQSIRASETLTLNKAIRVALANNPAILAAQADVTAAEHRLTQAGAGRYPQIYLSETVNRTNSPLWAFGTRLNQEAITSQDFDPQRLNNPDDINNFETALTASWTLWEGGRQKIQQTQAQTDQQAADQSFRRAQQQVIAQAASRYVGTLLAEENHRVVLQAIETAQAHFKSVQDRHASGMVVKSDLLRAQVRLADLEQQKLQTHSGIQVALAQLNAALGRPDPGPLKLVTPFQDCRPTTGALDEWVAKALQNRPDFKQLQLKSEMAQQEIKRARSEHLPSVALQGNYTLNTEDFSNMAQSYAVGGVVRLNLFSGHRISAQVATAQAQVKKLQALQQALALGIRVETQQAYYQAQSSWQSIAVARQAVDQADESLRIVGNRYRNGLLTIVDLLDAQQTQQQARTRMFRSLHGYKTARIQLALAAGTIDADFR